MHARLTFPRRLVAWALLVLCGSLGPVARSAEPSPPVPPSPEQIEFFEQRIRPHLVHACYECHGSTKAEGGLRIDFRDGLRAGGDSGPAIIPGDARGSLLLQAIEHRDTASPMPKDRPKLPELVIADFVTWVNAGASDPRDQPGTLHAAADLDWPAVFAARKDWWSLSPLQRQEPPDVDDAAWARTESDRFVYAKLREHGLRPAGRASPRAWLRRVHFAITGLPPTPAEVAAFLADDSETGRARVVDQLLASPSFGERWARHWMDLVRYAESYGHEQDYEIPHAWQYRDYLIRAFNADLPYQQFVKEHIAGDLLRSPRVHPTTGGNESEIATGFWYLHQATHAPVDPLQDEADRIDNQVDVFSKAFLSLTVACARCHDHKFDAISTRDYYSLAAFLRGSRQNIALLDAEGGAVARGASTLRAVHDRATEKLTSALRQLHREGGPQVAAYLLAAHEVLHGPAKASDADSAEHDAADQVASSDAPQTERFARPAAIVARENGLDRALLDRWVQSLRSAEAQAASHPLRRWLELSAGARDQAAPPAPEKPVESAEPSEPAYEVFPGPSAGGWFVTGWAFPSQAVVSSPWRLQGDQVELLAPGVAHSGLFGDDLQGILRSPTFELKHDYIHLRVAGTGGQVRLVIARYGLREFNPLLFGETLFDVKTDGVFEWRSLSADIRRYRGKRAYFEFVDRGAETIALDQIVFSDDARVPAERDEHDASDAGASLAAGAHSIEAQLRRELGDWLDDRRRTPSDGLLSWMSRSGLLPWNAAAQAISQVVAEVQEARPTLPKPTHVLAMTDGSVEETRVMVRGNHKTLGEQVERRFLEAVSGPTAMPIAHGSGRLELAEVLVSDDNPILFRAFVNRVWAHLFGRGIAASVDNLGRLGETPTHPELLDYLAMEFRDGGSLKRLVRSLCLTEAFALSSAMHDQTAEAMDPGNVWLHRQRLRRLEAEIVRDNVLAVAGNLDATQFGPSVPTHLSPFMGDPFWLTGRGIQSGPLDGNRRRSIYLESRRNFLSPFLLAFDLAVPDTTVGLRNTSNVPAQSLALMNDPFVRQQAEAWARRELAEANVSASDRIERLFVQALVRPPRDEERAGLLAFLESQARAYGVLLDDRQPDVRPWADACHLLFMTKEFIYVP